MVFSSKTTTGQGIQVFSSKIFLLVDRMPGTKQLTRLVLHSYPRRSQILSSIQGALLLGRLYDRPERLQQYKNTYLITFPIDELSLLRYSI